MRERDCWRKREGKKVLEKKTKRKRERERKGLNGRKRYKMENRKKT